MGIYLNPTNAGFSGSVKSKMYVDKSNLIRLTNAAIGDPISNRIVVSRPRRFGKTMALSMLVAYYSCGCNSEDLFKDLKIADDPSFETHLNRHNVIRIDVQGMYSDVKRNKYSGKFRESISETINRELAAFYPDEVRGNETNLANSLTAIYAAHGARFIFLIDEWDAIYRDEKSNIALRDDYTSLLHDLFKGLDTNDCIELVYMTGILPIPEEETLWLNNFLEYTMFESCEMSDYFGFTESEVDDLCARFQMPQKEIKEWYEGYRFRDTAVCCPFSVVRALTFREAKGYWHRTAAATELFEIMNNSSPEFQEAIRVLMSGGSVGIDDSQTHIDMNNLSEIDDALTAMVHLGYLTFNQDNGTVSIPNREVASEYVRLLGKVKDSAICGIIARSKKLLYDTLAHNEAEVAKAIQENHLQFSSINTYNQESDLAFLILVSYYEAVRKIYFYVRELPTGNGFADLVFLPKTNNMIPIIVELKWNEGADGAIRQIKDRKYTGHLTGYPEVLLVGISYEKDSKESDYKVHKCIIEQVKLN